MLILMFRAATILARTGAALAATLIATGPALTQVVHTGAQPPPLLSGPYAPGSTIGCGEPAGFSQAAMANASSLYGLNWNPFGPPEQGWAVYEPLIAHEIGVSCAASTPGFAAALAAFQAKYAIAADGVMSPATFEVFKGVWQERRPFVMMRVQSLCPDAPLSDLLISLPKTQETFNREGRALRLDAFRAYQRMVAAARAESPPIRSDAKALSLFSGYRSAMADRARCETEHNCDGAHRAACSAHRTGTAVDLNVGWMPGLSADTASTANRLMQTRSPAYRWLVDNAARFGFVNYPFEPWHWEYVGPLTAVGQTPIAPKQSLDQKFPLPISSAH